MMYKAKATVFSDIRTEYSKLSENYVEFLNIKPGGAERNR